MGHLLMPPFVPSTLAADDGFHFSAQRGALGEGRDVRKRQPCCIIRWPRKQSDL